MSDSQSKVLVADIMEAAAQGVLRALEARRAGEKPETRDLVAAGFRVDLTIRCGGYPPWPQYGGGDPSPQAKIG